MIYKPSNLIGQNSTTMVELLLKFHHNYVELTTLMLIPHIIASTHFLLLCIIFDFSSHILCMHEYTCTKQIFTQLSIHAAMLKCNFISNTCISHT